MNTPSQEQIKTPSLGEGGEGLPEQIKTPSLGEGWGGLREGSQGGLLLTRLSSNPTCTLGELTSSDGQLRLVTKEGRIPADRQSYIMRCLPPGQYPIEIEYCCIMYKDKPIRAYWPVLKKVPWFPHAGFYTGTAASANKGRIKLGMESADEYTITDDEEACRQMVRWSKAYYDAHTDDPTMVLEVLQPEDQMHFSDISEHDYRIADQLATEKAEQEALAKELGLDSTSPLSPSSIINN